MKFKLGKFLIGESLKTEELKGQKLNVFWGLPILSSDAISSVAYAGEEILWVLIPVIGMMAYKYMFLASLCIVFLMFVVTLSYRQTIDAYPGGGGSYVVAKDNLGKIPGLVAGASLTIGYILTVAVSASAGTAAITSAIPEILHYKVLITILLILVMTIGNLRGLRESSKTFGTPTYIFMILILAMIVWGIFKVKVLGYTPMPVYKVPQITGDITLFLFLRAFSSGCTALTGIEAVSNAIPNFEEPSQKNAKMVLGLLSLVVFLIFGGLSYLATLYHAVPNSQVTVVAQIASQVFGNNILFYVVQGATAIILILASNTAFAGLPMLLAYIAKDGFAPRQFAKRGKRLGYSNGIVTLSIISIILVIIFKSDTHYLMPLYAVGVFISFTLSQLGMFIRWRRKKQHAWRRKSIINGIGAFITFVTAVILGITKFISGAWIVFIVIPILVYFMLIIKKHYSEVARQLKLSINEMPKEINFKDQKRYVIVPIDTLNKSFLKALNYARTISDNIIIFHVSVDDMTTEKLLKKWNEYNNEYNMDIPIIVKKSPYRSIVGPLVKFIESEEYSAGPKDTVTVVLPQFVVTKWWGNILHNQTALLIKTILLKRRNIAIVTVPYIIFEK
ncbi:amino acid permease [Clostridium tyrobutyricum]|uniref:Amino acid permease n=1 Tax=Clostridium tyrobutyricum DIVETGP TaxID=1408889 RepID=W6N8D1_CLOTY|nr:APC family permease [Clostridium tyrobutyricum]AND85718.1 amino acid permease [Clostridium tyrobutyricum]ANP70237.1 amino acid permease [Clostridium tyrobutyricum]MBV4414996.1 APC family permease [Clostridium tyrobutyricum]MBV4421178.1 APC family permease [Clostridium tyrobutyricum]MBV4424442.1 APC family permease [Clostridium tyrobutyricum]